MRTLITERDDGEVQITLDDSLEEACTLASQFLTLRALLRAQMPAEVYQREVARASHLLAKARCEEGGSILGTAVAAIAWAHENDPGKNTDFLIVAAVEMTEAEADAEVKGGGQS